MKTNQAARPFDIIVFGATSFVGEILCRHLVERHGSSGPNDSLKWAIAGRSADKLASVITSSGADASLTQIVADARNVDEMNSLVTQARVIVSTVGPYALYGNELVAAAVSAGTDYCDLTGETQWMRRMIDQHHVEAQSTGARIVHACGFDSIPSDLGVWFTQQQAIETFGQPCTSIAMRVKAMNGGASGGTLASVMNVMDEVSDDPSLRKVLANPYALAPAGMRDGVKQVEVLTPKNDAVSGSWVAPFVMASVNTRVVHRSHALLGRPWGADFAYGEAMMTGDGALGAAKAAGVTGGLAGFMGAAAIGPVRSLLATKVLPQPGEGPSPEQQEAGFFDLRFFGSTADGHAITTRVTGDRDPGYGSTAKMLGEAARVLAASDVAGGFWTPSTSMGSALVDALTQHAGLEFTVLDPAPAESSR